MFSLILHIPSNLPKYILLSYKRSRIFFRLESLKDYEEDKLRGNVIQKVVPFPISLSTLIVPPWASTICRTIESPKPIPPSLRDRALLTLKKRSKMKGKASLGIPSPSS